MPFALTIVTPSGEVYRGDADSILLPGSEGEFGVMPNHERFLTPLKIGTIEIVWSDCENATLTYDIDPPGVSGIIELTRITLDNVALCEVLAEP